MKNLSACHAPVRYDLERMPGNWIDIDADLRKKGDLGKELLA
jgi:type III secretory pathway component EscV